jgi:nicotinamidase-related amidase
MKPVESAVHLCVDMQRIFAKGGVWETPWMERVLPIIAALTARYSARTVFPVSSRRTRQRTRQANGDHILSAGRLRPGNPLGARSSVWFPNSRDMCRRRRSSISQPIPPSFGLRSSISFSNDISKISFFERHIKTVVVSGAETDVCVLSTVLDAVDIGFRVVIVEDALCSSSDAGHDALMTMYRLRFNEQIDLVSAEQLVDVWRSD